MSLAGGPHSPAGSVWEPPPTSDGASAPGHPPPGRCGDGPPTKDGTIGEIRGHHSPIVRAALSMVSPHFGRSVWEPTPYIKWRVRAWATTPRTAGSVWEPTPTTDDTPRPGQSPRRVGVGTDPYGRTSHHFTPQDRRNGRPCPHPTGSVWEPPPTRTSRPVTSRHSDDGRTVSTPHRVGVGTGPYIKWRVRAWATTPRTAGSVWEPTPASRWRVRAWATTPAPRVGVGTDPYNR